MNGNIMKQIKQMDYNMEQAEKTIRYEEKRNSAWESGDCRKIYSKLIEYAGGSKKVRKGMQGQAKQLAITSYLRSVEPNYKKFNESVEIANYKRDQNKQQKRRMKNGKSN